MLSYDEEIEIVLAHAVKEINKHWFTGDELFSAKSFEKCLISRPGIAIAFRKHNNMISDNWPNTEVKQLNRFWNFKIF
jgi:hypothetical protein